ncbi:MAG: hypothetical protein ACLPUO_23655 [Streptosporangiaceae bacterium]
MARTSLTPDEIRAAAEIHSELGPDYQAAVIESFMDKVDREIDQRVDARMAGPRPARGHSFALAIVSMALGIPLSAIAVGVGQRPAGIAGLLVIWAAIAVINTVYGLQFRPSRRR